MILSSGKDAILNSLLVPYMPSIGTPCPWSASSKRMAKVTTKFGKGTFSILLAEKSRSRKGRIVQCAEGSDHCQS